MKKVLSLFLALVFALGICFSAPITIEAFAVENEVVENTNPIVSDNEGIYNYQLTVDEDGYILHGPVVNQETGAISVSGDITLPAIHPDDSKPVVELADNAFMYAGGITSVTIPGSYKKIGAYVFCDTPSLTSVTLEDGVEEIGMYAFSDCSNLVNVTFPETVTKVGEGVLSETAYAGWSNGEWNPNENWINDALFAGDILIDGLPNRYAYGPNEYAVKYGTKTIADKAMYNYGRVYDVIIPESVVNIGEMAFGYYDHISYVDDVEVTETVKVENFTISGTKGSAAETYANENGFLFEELEMSNKFQYKLSEDGESYKILWCTATDNFSEIVIPSEYNGKPVTEIGNQILSGRSAVVSVVVPDSIEIIGDFAFAYCYNLEEITLPDKPLKMGRNIVYNTKYHNNEDNWNENALYIGSHLLEVSSNNLSETMVVKDGTTDIASYAFCSIDGSMKEFSFTTLKLPNSLVYVGDGVFENLYNITSIEIDEDNGVKEIGDYCFNGCSALTNFPFNRVEVIGVAAFWGNSGIKELALPNTLTEINDSVFNQNSIEKLTIPDSIITIGEFAFATSFELKEVNIGANVKTIEECAFYDCNALTTISVSSSVEFIGKDAFAECDNLENINVAEDNEYFSSVNGVLYNKDKTEILCYPPKSSEIFTIPASIEKLPDDLFKNEAITSVVVEEGNENFVVEDGVLYSKDMKTIFYCAKDKSGDFTVPESVINVNQNAFANCINLTSVTFFNNEDFEAIGKQAFKNCEKLEKVDLPTNLTSIQTETFYGCGKLVDITLPDTISFVDSNAFQGTAITNLEIPEAMTKINDFAFYGMGELLSINIPETVKEISGYAFSYCGKATELLIPDSVEYIGPEAFSGCSGITEVTIPENVESIEFRAFANCSSLEKVTIYAKKIGKEVFNGCTVLSEIVLKDTIQTIYKQSFIGTPLYDEWNGVDDLYLYVDNDETKLKFWLAAGSNTEFSGDYTLPTDIITFASGIFEYTTLSDITIPGNIKSLPDYAFTMCTFNSIILNEGLEYIGIEALGNKMYTGEGYTELVLPSTLKNIEKGAFTWYQVDEYIVTEGENNNFISEDGFVYDKDKTVIYAVPNVYTSNDIYKMPDTVERFNGDVFYNRSIWAVEFSYSFKSLEPEMFKYHSISKIILPEGITTIPDECFYGTSIEEIVIPSTVTQIGDRAFKDCYNLKSVILPQGLQKIGEGAFEYCTSLNSINLSETKVESIDDSCFEYCTSLKGISMPETLEEIPSRCFASCNNLEGILFANVSEIAPSAFFGCSSLKDVIVPESIEEIGDLALGYADPNAPAQTTYNLRSPRLYNSARTTFTARASTQENVLAMQMEDFIIYGESGSEAEQYAKENDFEFKDSTGVHFHIEGQWEIVKQATCDENGEKVRHCADETCDYIYPETEIIWYYGHSYSDWVRTTEPTCSKGGEETQYCSKCGDTQTRAVATIAHTFSDGVCSVCNVNENDLVSLKPYDNNLDEIKVYHKDGANRIAITFSADTYIQNNDYVYIYAEEKDANQTYGDVTNNYLEDSSIVKYQEHYQWEHLQNKRLFVHDTDTVVVRLVTDGNTEEWNEPNFEIVNIEYFTDECSHETKKTVGAYSAEGCGFQGYTGKVICANNDCQKVFDEGTYIQLPHTVTDWTITSEATCYNPGQKMGVCDVCGNYDYQSIDMLSHTFGEWEVQSEATCMNYGTLYRKCTNNGCWHEEWDSSSLTPVGHSYGDWNVSYEPTCENNGYKYRYCIYDCGVMEEEWTEATGHQGEWVITESTCTLSGKKVFDCTVDGCDYYIEEKIQKLSHSFDDDGVCTSCGKSETECIETPDPYTESQEFKIYKENATRIKITFSEDTNLYWEDGIYIYDEEATGDSYYNDIDDMGDIDYVAYGYQNSLAGKTLIIESDTVIIRLVVCEENYENCRGFALTNVEYFYDVCNHEATKVINQKDATCTERSYSGDTVCANDSCLKLISEGQYGNPLGHNFNENNKCTRCGTDMWSYCFYDDMEDEPSEIVISGYLGSEKELTIPSEINGYKVVGIESYAFSGKNIKSVVIPEGVTYIGYGAFEYCEQLEKVTISSTVKSIGRYAFYGCDKLNVEIVSGNPYFTVEDNIIFNKDKTEINYVVNCDDVVFEVPNGVTKITTNCFDGMYRTKTIVIPATVEVIDNSVFAHYSIPLKNIVVANANKNYSSKDGVLYSKDGTTLICCPKNNTSSLYIPNGVKTIENGAISGSYIRFVSIPDSVETIEDYAISNCYNLTSFVIGSGLKTIGDGAFCSMYWDMGDLIHIIYTGSEAQWNAIEKGEENYDLSNSKIHYNSTETILGNWSSVEPDDGCDSVSTNRTCECGFNQYDWVSGEHCYGETTTVIASTCIENGIGTKTCSECEVVECVILPLAEHKSVNVGTVGIHTKCSVCGVTTSTKHTYKETIQDSTCSAEGIKTYTCDCGYSYTEAVDKKAHTSVNGGEKGIHSKCKDCGATLSTQHTYSRSETQATCGKDGTVKFSCSCGYYYTETIPATGAHNQNTKIPGKAATCTATGLTEGAKCSVCGITTVAQKEIAKLSHNQNTKLPGKAGTCTATGLTEGAKCSVCGIETKAQQVIPATGHNTNTKVPAVAATCTQAGLTEGAKCSVCGVTTKAQQAVPATGHKPTLVGKKDATTKEAGYTGDQVCSVCNTVTEKGKEIPKIIVSLATPSVTIKNTAKGIEVNWNAIENAENYIVYRSVYNTKTKKWSKWSAIKKGVIETSYVDGTVILGTSYKYTVRAVNGDVMSKYIGTDGLKYNVKPTVKISNVAKGVKVTWSTAANATGYTVYRSTYSGGKWSGWKDMGTAKATKTSWTDTKVKSGVQYKYTVRACYNKIKSSYKDSNTTIFLTQPTVKFANASNGIKVSWSKVSGATGYTVYRSQLVDGKWTKWKDMGTAKSTKTSWTDKKVESGVTYKYTVRAVNGKIKSSYTDTKGLLYLAQPTVTVKAVSNGINVAWSQCEGATGYTVYRSEYNTKTKKWSKWKSMGTAKATKSNWTDKKATKGVKYKYTVRAVNADTGAKSTYVASKEVKR